MAIVKTDDTHYSNIASAIRSVNGSSETYHPHEMAQAIREFHDADFIKMINGTLASIVIPEGITEIRTECFVELSSLKSVTFPSSLITIKSSAFQETGIEQIDIPDSVTTIGDFAFYLCKSLKTVHIGSNVASLGSHAFEYSDIEEIEIPEPVKGVLPYTFANCPKLKTVTFRGKPYSTLNYTFGSCEALTDIYVPWSEGEVSRAPWGATNATVHYNS